MSRKFMEALFLFRNRRYEESIVLCTEILKETPLDKVRLLLIYLKKNFKKKKYKLIFIFIF